MPDRSRFRSRRLRMVLRSPAVHALIGRPALLFLAAIAKLRQRFAEPIISPFQDDCKDRDPSTGEDHKHAEPDVRLKFHCDFNSRERFCVDK